MKMHYVAVFAIATSPLIWSSASHATSYNLANDFSNTANPNGVWSYVYGGNPLPHQASAQNNGNPTVPAIPVGGYFSGGSNLNTDTPFVFKAAVNGSSAGLTNNDFLAGDILFHSPNDGSNLSIIWTAPTAGTATNVILSYWYAHSSVTRSNDIGVYFAGIGSVVDETSTTNHADRNNAGSSTNASFHFDAGETLILTLGKSLGQEFGSLTGIQIAFDFEPDVTTTPIPGALPLFASGLAGLGAMAWRKKRKTTAA